MFRYYFIWYLCLVPTLVLASNDSSYLQFKSKYGKNKAFSTSTELPALLALYFYPELADIGISFKHKPIYTTMSTRPRFATCLFGRRKYVVYINSDAQKVGSVSFDSLNLEQKMGIMAHELAHISDYEQQNTLQLLITGLRYKTSKSYHRAMERKTDQLTVAHGLADPLYAFAYYVLFLSHASEEYKAFKKNTYLSPEEIRLYDAETRLKRKSP